jgi:molybdate-binding protein/DNA-binding transcriptional regulator YhcF (GntR family)
MDDLHLYQQITKSVQHEILAGHLKPGDRLPSIRAMMAQWGCTPGTVQRAYQELARQGLVVSRSGQGTHVVGKPTVEDDTPLRRAMLINRAETFLLEVFTAGYSSEEVENALQLAWDRWRVTAVETVYKPAHTIRFAGSHDPAVIWLANHFNEIINPGQTGVEERMQVQFSGSLGGLITLAQGNADLAGCHLWDVETDTYNEPFVRRLLPGMRVALLTLAHRRLGLIVPAGNPFRLNGLADLTRPDLRFVNRQSGSGTRVWLDATLHKAGILPEAIQGYEIELNTHSEVALAVAQGDADVGFGLETTALSCCLDFIYLVRERYDLVIPEQTLQDLRPLVDWLQSAAAQNTIAELGGYDTHHTGTLVWVEQQ